MHTSTLALALAAALPLTLLPACEGSKPAPVAQPSASRSVVGDCAQTFDDAGASGSMSGDVDGDGKADEVSLVIDADVSDACQVVLAVETASALSAAAVVQEGISLVDAATRPTLRSLVEIDGREGLEVVVTLLAGASTQFAGVFTMGSGQLERLRVEGDAPETDDLFPFGGSVAHVAATDCTPRGVVVTEAISFDGEGYEVTRRFFEFADGVLELRRSEREMFPSKALGRLEEMASVAAPFATCPVA